MQAEKLSPMLEIEIEGVYEGKKRLLFLKINLDTEEIWVDTHGLPVTAFLCAMFDGIDFITGPVGENSDEERSFLPMNWLIDEWGGDKQLVDALKKRKAMELAKMEDYRTKYGEELK